MAEANKRGRLSLLVISIDVKAESSSSLGLGLVLVRIQGDFTSDREGQVLVGWVLDERL